MHPLALAAVYTLAFRYIIKVPHPALPGVPAERAAAVDVLRRLAGQATGSVADNSSLVRKVAFPRVILPVGAVVSQFAQFALMYAVIIPIGAALGPGRRGALVALVPLVLLQLAFTLGLALLLATAYVYFRDTRHLVEVALQICSGSRRSSTRRRWSPSGWRPLLWLNPMAAFVTAYHAIVVEGAWPSPPMMLVLVTTSVVVAMTGFVVFTRHQRRFAELV